MTIITVRRFDALVELVVYDTIENIAHMIALLSNVVSVREG